MNSGNTTSQASFEQWFEPIGPTEQNATVFAFPFAGSGIFTFASWRNKFPNTNLFAAKLPGRDQRLQETPRENLLDVADEVADTIAAWQRPSGPLCFVGFSLGAVLAFEVTRRLQSRKVRCDLLVAGAARAPHGNWSRGKLHRMPDDRFLAKLNDLYGAVPQAVIENAEMRELVLPMLRGDIKMYETYRYQPGPPVDCEILTLSGTEDAMVKPKHVYPWRELGSSYRHRSFSGGHYFVREHTTGVLNAIRARIARL